MLKNKYWCTIVKSNCHYNLQEKWPFWGHQTHCMHYFSIKFSSDIKINNRITGVWLQLVFITIFIILFILNWHKVLTNHSKHVRLDLIREQILFHEGKQFHSFETNIMMQGYIYAIGHMFIWNAPYLVVLSFAAICSMAMFYSFKLNSRL